MSDSGFDTPKIINPPSSHLEATPPADVHMTPSAEANLAPADVSIPASPANQGRGMPLSQTEQQVGEPSINGELP